MVSKRVLTVCLVGRTTSSTALAGDEEPIAMAAPNAKGTDCSRNFRRFVDVCCLSCGYEEAL